MSAEKDQVFFKNFSIIVAILALMMVVFFVAANVIGDIDYGGDARVAQIAERTEPLGEVRVEGEALPGKVAVADAGDGSAIAAAGGNATPEEMLVAEAGNGGDAAVSVDGKAVYEGTCIACHGSGIPGIPQFGDAAGWAPHIKKGIETLHKHAIHGFQGSSGMAMPPRGGNTALSDAEVKAAVDYMVKNSQ